MPGFRLVYGARKPGFSVNTDFLHQRRSPSKRRPGRLPVSRLCRPLQRLAVPTHIFAKPLTSFCCSFQRKNSSSFSLPATLRWSGVPSRGLPILSPPIAAEHAAQAGIQCFHIEAPVDESVVGGLLLGSFGFGEARAHGAAVLPTADLAHDLLVLADTEEDQRRFNEQHYAQQRRNRAIFTLLAPPVAVFAALLAIFAGLIVSEALTSLRDAQADKKTKELKPALDRRKSYEANLKWYQEFIKQVSSLRRQQPVGMGLLYQLNSNYPFNIDSAFYVSDLKLQPTGDVEIKGFSKNKDSVAAFLKTLEFMGGPESGSRLLATLLMKCRKASRRPPPAPVNRRCRQ